MRDDLEPHACSPLRYVSNPDGTIVLIQSRFRLYEGEMPASRHTKIGVNIGTTSRLYRRSEIGRLDTCWRRNGVTVNLPNDPGVGCSEAVTMIGLAVDFGAFAGSADGIHVPAALEPLATSVTVDTVAARLLRKLFGEAELHGCSDAFFEAGFDALVRRLSSGLVHAENGKASPLDASQLNTVCELVEAHLAEGLSVRAMAAILSMDQTHFAKRFRSAAGMAPFAYLTMRRMERAKTMLRGRQRIIDIAQAVGYANPSKFAAAFRRYTGVTPRVWAEQAQANRGLEGRPVRQASKTL